MTKTCLITGAASGIGYEFAKIFHSNYYNLVLIDVNIEKLKEIKKDFESGSNNNVDLMDKDLSKPNVADEIYEDLQILRKFVLLVELVSNDLLTCHIVRILVGVLENCSYWSGPIITPRGGGKGKRSPEGRTRGGWGGLRSSST